MAKLESSQNRWDARQLADWVISMLFGLRERLELEASMRVAEERNLRRWATRWLGLFWSVSLGIISCLLPLSLMAVLMSPEYAPAGAMLSLILVGLVTYASDWKAGAAGIA